MPRLLLAAFVLYLIDWALMVIMGGGKRLFDPAAYKNAATKNRNTKTNATATALVFLMITMMGTISLSKQASAADAGTDVTLASQIHLAYVKSGSAELDRVTERGLSALSQILSRRTSVEPGEVVGVNPESDELSFFPLIYWPVSDTASPLSTGALRKIQHYLDHGGTILFDTRDQISNPGTGFSGGGNSAALRAMVQNLNIPPLAPITKDHVLSKSFYLLQTFPGKYTGGTLWVEEKSGNGRDGVSSVIIGSHDWGFIWADTDPANTHGGRTRKQELAYRFGVNLVMYALTGNYKADQVHVPHILERLGQ